MKFKHRSHNDRIHLDQVIFQNFLSPVMESLKILAGRDIVSHLTFPTNLRGVGVHLDEKYILDLTLAPAVGHGWETRLRQGCCPLGPRLKAVNLLSL